MRRCLTLFLMLCLAGYAFAVPPVKRLYVFGDSYSDIGRGWVDSDGPTAVAYLAQRMGLSMVPSSAKDIAGKSLNFASSGARTGEGSGRLVEGGGLMGLGMKNQVREFAAMVQAGTVTFDPQTTLFFIAGGLNDKTLPTEETVANLEDEIRTLHGLGARRFRVAVLPEKIPAFSEVGIRLNSALFNIPKQMKAEFPAIEIETTHWGHFFDVVITHPADYGLTNTTDHCAGRSIMHEDTTPCASPSTYFYYHKGHPSTAVAKAVGDMLYQEMQSE